MDSSPECNGNACFGSCSSSMNQCYSDADCMAGETCDPVDLTQITTPSPVANIPNCPQGGGVNCGGYCAAPVILPTSNFPTSNLQQCSPLSDADPSCGNEPCR